MGCIDLEPFDCSGQGGTPRGPGTLCATFDCEDVVEACCFADGSCYDIDLLTCLEFDGTPQGNGTSCALTSCPPPPQACCRPNGTCSDVDSAACLAQSGFPQGPGTICAEADCAPQACCFDNGACFDYGRDYCIFRGGQPQGLGTNCATFNCPQPPACCLPDGTCIERQPDVCTQIWNGFPQGPGSSCATADCAPRACCFDNGACFDYGRDYCIFRGGQPQPAGTNCATFNCPQPPACCLPDGTCIERQPDVCISAWNGIPQGPGTSCATVNCPQPQACCLPNGSCIDTPPNTCTTQAGTSRGPGTTCATPNICDGACCHGNGTCTQTTPSACNGPNDSFKGLGTNCANFRPTITAHPQNAVICAGANVTFSVTANGNGTLHYQWRKNGANVGADSNTLPLTNVPAADDNAQIVCVVTDDCGSVTSNAATLRVFAGTPNAVFPPANGALNGPVAASIPLGACTWGLTYPESVTVTISASCETGQWCAVLTGLTGNYSLQARLIPTETEVTGPGGNTNQGNFCRQARELNALGVCPGGRWYMLAAVQAHENVHLTRFLPALQDATPAIEASFEALCVPMTPTRTQAQAIAAIQALPAYAAAVRAAQATWLARVLARVAGDHAAGGPTDIAEHGVVDGMVNNICNAANNNCWGPCNPPCPAATRGACCGPGGACSCETAATCGGGAFQGVGTTCNPNPCGP